MFVAFRYTMPRPPKPKRGKARRTDIDPKLPKTNRKKAMRRPLSVPKTGQERELTDESDIDLAEDVEKKCEEGEEEATERDIMT